ncbi:MAG: ABC transporter permease, partial [Bacteroidales bacterium]
MFKKIKTGIAMTGQFYRDEMTAIFKDGGAILILLGAIIIYSLMYGFAYKKEVVRQIETIVVDLDNSSSSRQLIRMVNHAEQIHVVSYAHGMDEARKLFFNEKEMGGILAIPNGFEKDLLEGRQANVSIYADGSYFLIYRQVIGGAVNVTGTFSAGVEIKKLMSGGKSFHQAVEARDPISADLHYWFNPSSGYATFIMPGIILIILQQTLLIGIGMIGGTGKEANRHSYLVPVALRRGGVFPILFGKTFSYLTIYLFNCLFTMVWVHHWFGYPDRASYLHVFMLTLPFLLSVIFMGITISVLFRRRESS